MEENKKNRKKAVAVLLVVLLILFMAGIIVYSKIGKKEPQSGAGEVVDWDIKEEPENTAGAVPGIQIPGYETMRFAAGETIQAVNIGNPQGNPCYFVITLRLQDGTELFRSDYLKPGEGFERIEIEKPLEAGEYTALVQYECYALEDESPLNGAEAEFQLLVN